MQIFEFLFNPCPPKPPACRQAGEGRRRPPPRSALRSEGGKKIKATTIFDSFIFEPENIDEKKLGHLCIVGKFSNPLPRSNILDNLAQIIKSSYYSFPIKPTPEKALKESLKKANEFLAETAQGGDVSWLGNLSLTVLTLGLNSPTNSIELNFTKAGDHKLFLLRDGQIIDISHDIELQNIEPYPPKAFGNIVSGQLMRGDKLLILTKDISSVFNQLFKKTNQNLLSHLAKVSNFNEKSIKKILKAREKELSELSGICLAINLSEKSLGEKLKLPFVPQRRPKEAKALKILISEKLNKFKKSIVSRLSSVRLFSKLSNKLSKLSPVKEKKKKEAGKIKKPSKILKFLSPLNPLKPIKPLIDKINRAHKILCALINNFISSQKWLALIAKKKNLVLISGFILILVLGFLVIGKQTQKENQEIEQVLAEAQIKIDRAENFLIFKDEKLANTLYLEAWQTIEPLFDSKKKKSEINELREKIENKLKEFNNLIEIKEPELVAELNIDFEPQRVISIGNNLYFYASGSNKVYETKTRKTIEAPQNIKFAVLLDSSVLFFLENNNLISLSGNQWSSEINIDKPFAGFTCDNFTAYNSNLYCLSKEKGQILKYNHFTGLLWGSAQNWLKTANPNLTQAKSITIDGSIWVLNQDNSIDCYRLGEYQETININIFPLIENITIIKTSPTLPELYLLEPSQNRIIILTKEGKIQKQIFSQKFDDLKDFTISADGKIIWLLNDLKIYQVEL